MGRRGRWWMVSTALLGLTGCEDEVTPTKDVVSVIGGAAASAAPRALCEGYCAKIRECFPKVVQPDVATVWPRQCKVDCLRDLEQGDHFGETTRAAAACTLADCGEPLGRCIDEQLAEMKVSAEDHRYLSLHPMCTLMHLCFIAGQYGYVNPDARDATRTALLPTQQAMLDNLRESPANLALGCRALVEQQCSLPSALERTGPPIAVDCDRYCAKGAACYPKLTASSGWVGNCRTACREEAAAGTGYAAFYAAVAGCDGHACGDDLVACIAEHVGASWPEGADEDWDMSEMPDDCQRVRLCLELRHAQHDALTARSSRRGQFGYYAKNHTEMTPGQCAAMRKSMVGSGECD